MSIQPPERRLVTEASLADPDSPAHATLLGTIGAEVGQAVDTALDSADLVTASAVRRIVASTDPDLPLDEGDLLLVYEAPPNQWFTNFDGADLTGHTKHYVQGAWTMADDATALDGKVVTISGATARRGLSYDAPGLIENGEVVIRVKQASLQGAIGSAAMIRGQGTADAEHGYIAGLLNDTLYLAAYNNGTYSGITGVAIDGLTGGEWVWIRLRAQGSNILARAWLDGATEPTTWQIDRTSTMVTGPGWAGILASAPVVQSWDVLGVASGQATAPKAAL